jgi:hypothetical protein
MFWLLSAMVLYGFAMLLIGVLLASGIGQSLVPHLHAHQMIPQLRHGRMGHA